MKRNITIKVMLENEHILRMNILISSDIYLQKFEKLNFGIYFKIKIFS